MHNLMCPSQRLEIPVAIFANDGSVKIASESAPDSDETSIQFEPVYVCRNDADNGWRISPSLRLPRARLALTSDVDEQLHVTPLSDLPLRVEFSASSDGDVLFDENEAEFAPIEGQLSFVGPRTQAAECGTKGILSRDQPLWLVSTCPLPSLLAESHLAQLSGSSIVDVKGTIALETHRSSWGQRRPRVSRLINVSCSFWYAILNLSRIFTFFCVLFCALHT